MMLAYDVQKFIVITLQP